MTKKSIIWICLGAILFAGLIVWGNILTKNLEEKTPTVNVAPSTQAAESTQPPTASEGESPAPPTESAGQPPEQTQSTATAPTQEPLHPTPPPTVPPTSEGEDLQARIDALVQEVYGLKDYYVAKLAYLESSAREEFDSLPAEKQTEDKRRSIALDCIDEAYAMESECDARMDAICSELSLLLLKTGGRMNLVNEIRYAYAKEKEEAKNQFLEKYAVYFG